MTMPHWLQALLAFEPLRTIPKATLRTALMYGALIVVFALIERFQYKRGFQRYATRPVINDYLYAIFFNGGYFTLLVYPLVKLTEMATAPWKLNLLPKLPLLPAAIAFYVIADFAFYWTHRLLHTKWLWPFHAIHHSQREMTYLTTARFHVFDVALFTVVTLIPANIIGWPAASIAAVSVILAVQEKVQHAAVEWDYGPLYWLVVSPRYHRIHHGADERHFHRNYSRMLPLWDHIFGTAHATDERIEEVGVRGLELHESLVAHFVYPFRTLAAMMRRGRTLPAAPIAPAAAVPAE
jgi:sterol desaturase/sphingolipid hydroxylase (fatty acid hydroxylase superfamily)